MPLGTLDRTPPPFFKQGPSALSKLLLFSALALFLMVADARFALLRPLRASLATVLYPAQWLMMRPVEMARGGGAYFEALHSAQTEAEAARLRLAAQSQRAGQADLLAQENTRLRRLLGLREQLPVSSLAAEVLYDAAEPYTRKVMVDKGQLQGVQPGSPVLDEAGVLGQVTRVYPLLSEITLIIDRDQAIPVLNVRTGARSVAYGDPSYQGGALELRFMAGNADVQTGDLLTTSGVDGVYPPGLPVARIEKIERRADSAFARIHCLPVAGVQSVRHVVLLKPLSDSLPLPPDSAAAPQREGERK